jgi:peptidoglycan/LPS O-acetylase OafA/YrhL
MKFIFIIIAVLIVYGSLFPFNFSVGEASSNGINALLNFNVAKTGFSDLVANIILFIPFGLFIRSAFPGKGKQISYFVYLIAAFIFAYLIQIMQLWTTDRLPWGGDAFWNTIGCAIGLSLYSFIRIDAFKQLHNIDMFKQISFALAAVLIVLKLAPFAPTIDFGVLKDNIKALIYSPSIDFYWTFEHTVIWLVAFYLLHVANPQWARFRLLVTIVLSVLGLKFFIISSNINLSQFLAGALALCIWRLLPVKSAPLLAGFMFLVIVGNGLYPFQLSEQVDDFKWLPFTGSLNGHLLLNIIVTTKKLAFYGGLVWLLYLTNRKLVFATVLTMLVLFVSEYLQTRFTNSVPESTDAFLALIMGFVFSKKLQHAKRLPRGKSFFNNELKRELINASKIADKQIATSQNDIQPMVSHSFKQAPTNHTYIAGFDGLRAVAALSVFVVHFQQFSGLGGTVGIIDFERWMVNGNTGVALFFILSGFLLSAPFWREIKQGSFVNVRRYMVNRAVRIIPIYYCCLFGLLALKGFEGNYVNFNNVMSHLFFLHNLKDYQVMSVNPPFWTLAVEFQFYLLLPVLFLLFAKLGFKGAQILCLLFIPLIYIAYRFFMQYLETYQAWPIRLPLIWPFGIAIESVKGFSLTYSLFAHLPHFLIGVVAASFFTLKSSVSTTKQMLAECVFWVSGVLVIAILATPLDHIFQLDYGRYNFPFVPVLLGFIVFCAPYTRFAKAILEFTPIKWIGVVSYGLYIFHYPIQKALVQGFALFDIKANEEVLLFALLSLAITLIFSYLSYELIESPLLRRFKKHKAPCAQTTSSAQPALLTKHVKAQPSEGLKSQGVNATLSNYGSNNMQVNKFKDEPRLPQNGDIKNTNKVKIASLLLAIGIILFAAGYFAIPATNKVQKKQALWAGNKGETMIFDHHAHTTYSDGKLSIEELAELAFFKGCDAFSITDHSQNPNGFGDKKLAEINQMREKYPGMLIFAGIELGMPSYSGREHVNIITTPEYEYSVLPAVLKELRTPSAENISGKDKDNLVFAAIDTIDNARDSTIAIYNHPSRKDKSVNENIKDVQHWNLLGNNIVSFAGAPGHQKSADIGSYREKYKPIDRWDPAVAKVGGTWDQFLVKGKRIWGAITSSDYHGDYMDYGPCEFSRIHVNVPTRDYSGIIKGIKAGTFWADHGKLLSTYDFSVSANNENNQSVQVYPGGTLTLVNTPEMLSVSLNVKRNAPFENDFLRFDIISNCGAEKVTLVSKYMPPEQDFLQSLIAMPTAKNCFIRSRLVRETADENDLSAYSNPIFIEF